MKEERFRLLVSHAPVCIHEVNLKGELTAMNPAGLAMMEVDEATICGTPYLDAVCDSDQARVRELLAQALLGRTAHFEFRSAGDNPRDFSSNFIPMHDDDGTFCGLMGVTQDVTKQRRAERAERALMESLEDLVCTRTIELERANDRLTTQNEDLNEFARAISHDLRSPLSGIVGLASLLLESSPQADQAADLEMIVKNGVRMAEMIEELLQIAQIGEITDVETGGTDLEQTFTDVCETLGREIELTNAVVTHTPLPTVHSSPTEQHRLLQNLVGNAIKFRGDSPPHVHISAEPNSDGWAISVRDNGLGIPETERAAIFRVFYRSQEDPSRPGSGVGLTICKKLVEARGGALTAVSTHGEGSTFTYTVPTL
ncbi:MAG: PAS domain S-box-containing protein [Bradymonadia bacterium]|jgi:PAS domain S-box-containing protein